MLTNEGIISNFKLFCVDNRLHELPVHLKLVPAFIIKNENRVVEGADTFKWLNNYKYLNGSAPQKQEKGILGLVEGEMKGMSDQYAYTTVDKAQPKTYFGIGEEEKNAIYTAPDIGKLSKKDQSNMIRDLETTRKDQDKTYANNMKKQQINVILDNDPTLSHKNTFNSSNNRDPTGNIDHIQRTRQGYNKM